MRKVKAAALVVGALSVLWFSSARAQGTTHQVETGDTLWDLSERYWDDASLWPELWALNPQVRNPHWIFPGELIHLDRPPRREAEQRVIRLPVKRLRPQEDRPARAAGEQAPAVQTDEPAAEETEMVRLARQQSQDFVSSHRLPRMGVVNNRHQTKVVYGTREDIEFDLPPGADVQPGDLLTVFEDDLVVHHPLTGEPVGYYVKIYGHLEVLGVVGNRAVGRVMESYDGIEEGAGLMSYREPLETLALQEAEFGVEGSILGGRPEATVFATEDVVHLDRGTLHGLEPGVVLEIPVRAGERSAQGLVDLGSPLATLVVVTTEEKSASSVILSSRAAIMAGDRFVAAPFSP